MLNSSFFIHSSFSPLRLGLCSVTIAIQVSVIVGSSEQLGTWFQIHHILVSQTRAGVTRLSLGVSSTIVLTRLVSTSLLHCSSPCSVHHVTQEGVVSSHSCNMTVSETQNLETIMFLFLVLLFHCSLFTCYYYVSNIFYVSDYHLFV